MIKPSALVISLPFTILISVIGYLQYSIVSDTGLFLYPLDDPYIHMAMARHFVEHGIFGVSLAGFSASSSAPGWTLLLSMVYFILGAQAWIPLALNFFAALLIMTVLMIIIHTSTHNHFVTAIIASVSIFIIPIPALVSLGMEHLLHCLFVLLLLQRTITLLINEDWHDWDGWILVYSLLAVSFRYESLFLITILMILLLVRGAWRPAIVMGASGFGLVCVLGIMQTQLGWMFFPNSILQKSILMNEGLSIYHQTLTRLFGQLFSTSHISFPFWFAWAGLIFTIKDSTFLTSRKGLLCLSLIGTYFLHCAFAGIGWFYRYESYMMVIAIVTFAAWYPEIARTIKSLWLSSSRFTEKCFTRGLTLLMLFSIVVIFSVNLTSVFEVVPGAKNLHEQQYQMGLFLNRYYENEAIAANDIGAINYLADIYCLDLMGLGSMEPLRANRLNRYQQSFLENWSKNRNAKIAIIYEDWFRGQIPDSWIKMAEWFTPNKVTVANQTVSIYALQPQIAEDLQNNLLEFQSQMPESVETTVAKRITEKEE